MVRVRNSNLWGGIAVFLIILGVCPSTAPGLDGSGTEEDPWLIQSLADFDEFASDANCWDDYTRLETDVNLAGRVYERAVIAPDVNDDWGWFQGIAFTGVFDGNGHKIMNMTVDDDGAGNDFLGLFGRIDYGGEVLNTGVNNVSIMGGSSSIGVGGLCGNNGGTVFNCSATGVVDGNDDVGGLCGINCAYPATGSLLTRCHSFCTVTGNDDVGGLCGFNAGNVSDCSSTGTVSGNDIVGGLCGKNYESINSCTSFSTVSGSRQVGGLVGANSLSGSIVNCMAEGQVSGRSELGGLVGTNQYGATITRSSAIGSVEGTRSIAGGLVGKNEQGVIAECFSGGEVEVYNDSIYIYVSPDLDVGGLVGRNSDGGEIMNCYSTSDVWGTSETLPSYIDWDSGRVGGLVGYTDTGTRIENCYSIRDFISGRATVQGPASVGGLVGSSLGLINNCFARQNVGSVYVCGGLVGTNEGTLIGSQSVCCVFAHQCAGRVVGHNRGTISDCSYSNKEDIDCFGLYPWHVGCNSGTATYGNPEVFATWDFDAVWRNCDDRPRLQWELSPADLTCPYGVSLPDFSILAQAWDSTPADANWDSACDLDGDEHIGAGDLAIVCDQWMEGM